MGVWDSMIYGLVPGMFMVWSVGYVGRGIYALLMSIRRD